MTAIAPSRASQPVPSPSPPPKRGVLGTMGDVVRRAMATTPGRYRLWSVALAALALATAVTGGLAASDMRSSADRVRSNSGPVLVATQDLASSMAEADVAATSAFLLGAGADREQRNAYVEAIARADRQLEEVSALIGDAQDSHEVLKDLSVSVTRYAGLVEAARAASLAGSEAADDYLIEAVSLLAGDISTSAGQLTAVSEETLEGDTGSSDSTVMLPRVLGVVTLLALLAAQALLLQRTHRLINVPMLIATVLVAVATAWLSVAHVRSQDRLERARVDGYESIAVTGQIQSAGFENKANETVALITGDARGQEVAEAAADRLATTRLDDRTVLAARDGASFLGSGLLFDAVDHADSARERAAVAEMLVRWQRYEDVVDQIPGVAEDERRALMIGPASSTFNGFILSVDSVLGDNRVQFLDGLDAAGRSLRGLHLIAFFVPLVAAAAVFLGFQVRINEYR